MSYDVDCFIVKADETKLTTSFLRSEGYSVVETLNGFLLISDYDERSYFKSDILKEEGYKTEERKNNLVHILAENRINRSVKFAYFYSQCFGGVLDLMDTSIYIDERTTLSNSEEGWNIKSKSYSDLSEAFNLSISDIAVFEYIGLGSVRSNTDFLTKEQISEFEKEKEKYEESEYVTWKEEFEKLSDGERFGRLIKIQRKTGSYNGNTVYLNEIKNIAKYYNFNYVDYI